MSCLRSRAGMRETAERTAALEQEVRTRQQAETDARSLASLTSAVGLALTKPRDLDVMLRRCAEALVCDLNAGLARIWTLNDADLFLELRACVGTDQNARPRHHRVAVGSSTSVGAIAEGRTLHVTSAEKVDPLLDDPDWTAREGIVAFAGLSAARRVEAGRRHGSVLAERVLAVGARDHGGGLRRGGGRRGTQARRSRDRPSHPRPPGSP